jgi:hypothetical protein
MPAAFNSTRTFDGDIIGDGVFWLISITSLLPYLLICADFILIRRNQNIKE